MRSSLSKSSLSNGSKLSVAAMLDEINRAVCSSEVSSGPLSEDSYIQNG